ncbi:MAG TPA: DUF4139 domain-containing protein [Chthonomonadaceae bacterium]|nr:DUF4139 domain-containing protein [Chthonomonadaceae bacterium]
MRNQWIGLSLLALPVLAGGGLVGCGKAGGEVANVPSAARQSVELTVYAQDFGMVRELRPMQLRQGGNRLQVSDVSKEMDPQSVLLRWEGQGANLPQLVAHAYDLGVANGDALLKRYLGQQVEVVRYGEDGREAERQKGTLMVEQNGDVVLQSDGKFLVHPPGTIVAPANGNVVTIPQLSVQADSPSVQAANLEVAYLTRGLSWSADYVATLAPQNNTLALECWATVTNRTGVDYPNAKVSLIAGMPNRAALPASARAKPEATAGEPDYERMKQRRAFTDGHSVGGRPAVEAPQAVGEFHAYNITSLTTVVQEQMNRLLILTSQNVSVIKDYSTRPPQLSAWDDEYYGWSRQPQRGEVAVALTFFNREKDGLGEPLPQGAIRLYEPDKSGALRYVGAAAIQDTPKDQKINITLARAFDVFTEWRLVKTQKINKHTYRTFIELTLHNEKAAPVAVRVIQAFGGRWNIRSESDKHIKLDAYQAQWKVAVPASGKAVLTYTVDLLT